MTTSAEQFNFDVLLAPITDGESPAGVAVPEHFYTDLEKLRKKNESRESESDDENNGASAIDWKMIYERSTKHLATKSKDLRLAFYIAESLVHQRGVSGMCDAFRLLQLLHERFWPTMFPRIDGNDLEERTMWLERVDYAFKKSIFFLPITQVRGEDELQLWHWQNWEYRRDHPPRPTKEEEKKQAAAQLAEQKAQIDKKIAKTSSAFFDRVQAEVSLCLKSCEECRAAIDVALRSEQVSNQLEDWPSFFQTRKSLETYLAVVQHLASSKPGSNSKPSEASSDAQANGSLTQVSMQVFQAEPATRSEAVNQLGIIADFFQKTEPHSPVIYLIERAIRWSRLPLTDVLEEILRDASALAKVKETLGIQPK